MSFSFSKSVFAPALVLRLNLGTNQIEVTADRTVPVDPISGSGYHQSNLNRLQYPPHTFSLSMFF